MLTPIDAISPRSAASTSRFFLRFVFRNAAARINISTTGILNAMIRQLERIEEGDKHPSGSHHHNTPRHLKVRGRIGGPGRPWRGHDPALSFLCISLRSGSAEDHASDCLKNHAEQ